uniref:Uncharacterized protein n=1 Tax=Anopheles albimanus TaxID=7167 RepID=A0A182FXZ3_ANOAL
MEIWYTVTLWMCGFCSLCALVAVYMHCAGAVKELEGKKQSFPAAATAATAAVNYPKPKSNG